ncbi:protein IL-40 isoform X3 [Kogia breviceps]|uniref:protein IL-40 isoform X3 n=1 Tax=Kogia breviceps TaxID=27615 RepID=UPI0027960D37|nr:protein IL-40 [Kogia breviceps]
MAVLLFCLAALATSSFAKQEKEPVSQLQADFTLLDRGSGLRVEVFCQASSGSPPITYRLVRRNGHIHMQQTQSPGQPANFSFPLSQTSDWFRCQAENDISVQHTTFTLVPPGELPQVPTFVLAGCLISIIAIFSWKLSWTKQIRC